jgi:hypothetical protein
MFLLDNLLLAPAKAVYVLLKELAQKAQEEWLDDESVKQELQQIYALLESGQLSEADFEAREIQLVERLQQIARAKVQGQWSEDAAADAAPPGDVDVTEVALYPDAAAIADAIPATKVAAIAAAIPGTLPAAMAGHLSPALASALQPLMEMAAASGALPGFESHFSTPVLEAGASMRPLAACSPEDAPLPPAWAPPAPPALPPPAPAALRPIAAAAFPSFAASASAPFAPAASAPPPVLLPGAPPAALTAPLTLNQVLDSALRGLSMLRMKVSSVTSVARAEEGWQVTAELVERRAVPDTSDLLGVYELRLDEAGNLLRWERTRMRRRCDLG